MCWCAVKNLLTHSLTLTTNGQSNFFPHFLHMQLVAQRETASPLNLGDWDCCREPNTAWICLWILDHVPDVSCMYVSCMSRFTLSADCTSTSSTDLISKTTQLHIVIFSICWLVMTWVSCRCMYSSVSDETMLTSSMMRSVFLMTCRLSWFSQL